MIGVAEEAHTAPLGQGRPWLSERRPAPSRSDDPRWLRLEADPTLVSHARRYAAGRMAKAGLQEERLVEDVRLVTSELVTNAMRATEKYADVRGRPWEPYEKPVAIRVECRPGWVHLLVTDPDPRMPEPEPRDFLDEFGGRGLTITESVGALMWIMPGRYGKTVHVVITRTGVELTPDEQDKLRRRVIV